MHAKATREAASVSAAGTLLQLFAADAKRGMKIIDFGIYGQGVDNLGKPLIMQLVIQTTAGTGGGTNTPKKLSRNNADSLDTTALDDSTVWSAEPTDSDILHEWLWHPQGGKEQPLVKEYDIKSGERVAIRVMETPGAAVVCSAYIEFEE